MVRGGTACPWLAKCCHAGETSPPICGRHFSPFVCHLQDPLPSGLYASACVQALVSTQLLARDGQPGTSNCCRRVAPGKGEQAPTGRSAQQADPSSICPPMVWGAAPQQHIHSVAAWAARSNPLASTAQHVRRGWEQGNPNLDSAILRIENGQVLQL